MPVDLSSQYGRRIRRIILCCVPCLALQYFPHYLTNETIFRQDNANKMLFLISSTNFLLRQNQRNIDKKYVCLYLI